MDIWAPGGGAEEVDEAEVLVVEALVLEEAVVPEPATTTICPTIVVGWTSQ